MSDRTYDPFTDERPNENLRLSLCYQLRLRELGLDTTMHLLGGEA